MDFILIPSLEHTALLNVAISLWNKQDFSGVTPQTCISTGSPQSEEHFSEIEGNIIANVNKLSLPALLKKKLLSFIKPMGWQIWTWFHYQNCYCGLDMKQKVHFCWTPPGSLDTMKTAKLLIQDENLDFPVRLQIVGNHCLEEDYYRLCHERAEICKIKNHKLNDGSFPLFVKSCLEKEFSLQEEAVKSAHTYVHDDDLSLNEYTFRYAAASGNEAATRYLFQKLTPEEKEKTLVKTACCVATGGRRISKKRYPFCYKSRFSNVFCFLLSIMTEKQQRAVFKEQPARTLMCFLDYPWQYLFLDVLERVGNFLFVSQSWLEFSCPFNSCNLVKAIYYKIVESFDDYDYEHLFQIVWQSYPDAIKISWVKMPLLPMLLLMLSERQDDKIAALIVNDILVLQEKDFIFQKGGLKVCNSIMKCKRLDLLKFFIQKNVSSKDLMIKFKEDLKREFFLSCGYLRLKEKTGDTTLWETCSDIIDECIQIFSERGTEDDAQPAKRLCSVRPNHSTQL